MNNTETLLLERIVGGGQALGTLDNGKKFFAWGGLPGELVRVVSNKSKKDYASGYVESVIKPSGYRINPKDPDSFLSTSPWQIMTFEYEQEMKQKLISEAFELHNISLDKVDIFSDSKQFGYRNKVEFSFYWNKETDQLDLAFFKRGTHSKIPIEQTSLASSPISQAALAVRDVLRLRDVQARDLKTLLIRSQQDGKIVFQLYIKNKNISPFLNDDLTSLSFIKGWEVIYSNPKSPASVITERLSKGGDVILEDEILGVLFRYACEGFFQVNIPLYEQALKDIGQLINKDTVVDLYSGVGSIGLTIGGDNLVLVESNESAVREMEQNISRLGKSAKAVLSSSEKALDYIKNDAVIIVDPPRAGLHADVVKRILDVLPERVIYLSCNPATQARDIQLLLEKYKISYNRGYNFFPRTPHIEHLVALDLA